MSRVLALVGNRPDVCGVAAKKYANLLRVETHGKALGWGIGFYQSGEALLRRRPFDDREVIERFNRMDLDEDGLLNQTEWERHARYFKQAQNAILAIKPTGRGELPENALVWKYSRGIPYVATPVLDHGNLWMVKEGGIVTKLDAATGRMLQEERVPGFGNYFASPVAGDDKVYFASESGTVSVVAAREDWRVISSRDFHEKIYATPVLDHGRVFIRTQQALYCFQGARP